MGKVSIYEHLYIYDQSQNSVYSVTVSTTARVPARTGIPLFLSDDKPTLSEISKQVDLTVYMFFLLLLLLLLIEQFSHFYGKDIFLSFLYRFQRHVLTALGVSEA